MPPLTDQGKEVKNWVEKYEEEGLVPIRTHMQEKKPVGKGWTEQTIETTGWNAYAYNDNNVAILTGAPSGVTVVDIDAKNDGVLWWQTVIEANPDVFPLPEGPIVQTGGGGFHG